MVTQLNHITLTTGHARWSPASEVSSDFLEELIPVIAECEAKGSAELDTPSGAMRLYRLSTATGRSESPDIALWTIKDGRNFPLVTIALSLNESSGRQVWEDLHRFNEPGNPKQTRGDKPPQGPWLAVIPHMALLLQPAGTTHPSAWLGDAERCIAWAWIKWRDRAGGPSAGNA